jgi:murein DD-endopeptidase
MISLTHKHLFYVIIVAVLIAILPKSVLNAEISTQQTFALPVECTLGRDCFIMHYVDLDLSDNEVDFGCGRQTYDKHDGTDFGISDLETMKRGVAVLAAAGGVVLRTRDGIADRLITDQEQKTDVDNFECGNGLVIDHGNGWQTQYCHMRNGTIAVKKGAAVRKGAVLGMVGSSGLASFPHVHFTVRYQGKIVDPFAGETTTAGCKVSRHPLWEKSPDYVPAGLISAGFAPKPPSQTELWQGKFLATKSNLSDLPALIFWVHLFGVLQGDKEHFTLIAPDKRVIIDTEKSLTKNNRSWVSYAGKRNSRNNPLSKGIWRGIYQLKRGGHPLINLERVFIVE